ncbi:SDR family oxidoreductase [Kineococcus glutinatus]|uniref:SDR family oxidoreductase n=1 Tax=Kineococcus glutinatus TaxID=1070872 RepID=A0ABP9I614_9ACTN
MDLQGTTALVTGATAGIGRATAEALAADGAHVLVAGRDADRAAEVVEAIAAAAGRARAVTVDLTAPGGVDDLLERAGEHGPLDVLVNNAGTYAFLPTADTDRQTFDAMVDLNVRVPFFLTAAVGREMAARGRGKIVNISSVAAHVGTPSSAAYGASKAALESLTRSWATEFGPHGVNVNAVAPGPTHTLGTSAFRSGVEVMMKDSPAGRPAEPAEIAQAVLFLVRNDFAHGTTVVVDGGLAIS